MRELEAKQLLAPFIATVTLHRPYVTLKWAESADGKVAGPGGQRTWISNPSSRRVVHALRSRCDAVLVGIGTVLADDPALTVRDVPPLRTPIRVVLDRALRTPLTAQLLSGVNASPVVIFCGDDADPAREAALTTAGARVMRIASDERRLDLRHVLRQLHAMNVTHLLVEPGPTLARAFLERHLADRVWRFTSPRRIDDATAPAAPRLALTLAGSHVVTDPAEEADRLEEYLDPAGPLFFSPSPSADFHLARGDL